LPIDQVQRRRSDLELAEQIHVSLSFKASGLVLGAGTVLIPAHEGGAIIVDGYEARREDREETHSYARTNLALSSGLAW
jgi:hypothetical protein